ncbi:MAG: TA system VapC family ribonuclease toxin [Actinomycetota bacterium]
MSFAVDANLLLYASDSSSPRRDRATELLHRLAEGPELVYLFWPVVVAYLRLGTHSSVFEQPLSTEAARENITALLRLPHVRSPGELEGFWPVLERACAEGVVRGNLVSDAHLVALMRQHGVSTIWTSDRDFRRFEGIVARDPFG